MFPTSLVAASSEPWVTAEQLHGLEFRSVGPFRGGRSTAVSGVVSDPFTFYMGTTGGGVWKTDNAGVSWRNISDGFFDSSSIGSISVALSDPNLVTVGTGSGCPRGNIMNGNGIYRSTDGGESWVHRGLADAGLIPRVLTHPDDSGRLYAAVLGDIFEPSEMRGVYRSGDGGLNWQPVLTVSDRTGAVDLAMNPNNPRQLFAAMWTAERKPWTLVDGSEEGGVYRSNDAGDTWEKLGGGLPTDELGRIGLAVSAARPERVWALVTAPEGRGGLFRSDDSGDSWIRVSTDRELQVRGWYYTHVEADPNDENTVWVLSAALWRSIDGGKSFERVPTPHGDNHALWIHPDDSNLMIEANDGGAVVTLDGGASWSSLHNQPTAEFYRLTVDDGFPYRLYAAQQDNTAISVPAWSAGAASPEAEWSIPGFGESGHIALDPENPDVIYAGNYIGTVERWDRTTEERRNVILYPELADGVAPKELQHRFQWNAPIRLSPHDPSVLYHASHRVHRSRDHGMEWETISDDLSYDDESKQELPGGPIQHDHTGVEVYGTVFALEESPLVAGELWAGTDDGRVHLSRDDGATWADITPAKLPEDTTVNTLELSRHDAGRAFIAAHRYRLGDDQPYIFRTDDYGATWKTLTDGIAANHPVRVVREDPENENLLLAGTENGLYASFDRGAHWQSMPLGLPVTQIADLAIHRGDVAVATHGRSFWVLDDIAPLRTLTPDWVDEPLRLLPPSPAYQVAAGGFGGGHDVPSARGTGAVIDLWLGTEVSGEGTLTILDAAGDVVREISVAATAEDASSAADASEEEAADETLSAGLNRLRWNFRADRPELLEDAVMSLGYTGGTRMPPGDYTVELEFGELEPQSQPLRIVADPRLASVTQADYDAGYALTTRVRDTLIEIHDTVHALRDVREQIEALQGRLAESGSEGSIDESAEALFERLETLEEELIQHRNEASQDPLNFTPRLDNQYAYLYAELDALRGRPNAGAYERAADLDRVWAVHRATWEEIRANELAAVEAAVEEQGVPTVWVPSIGDEE